MIGIDLVFIPEFQRQLDIGGGAFLASAFHVSELNDRGTEHLAGLWAAKEAVIKARGNDGTRFVEVLISHDERGVPSARVNGQSYAISIAHHGEYAVAVAERLSQ